MTTIGKFPEPTLNGRLPSGEVVAIGTEVLDRIGDLHEQAVIAPGASVSIGAIAVLTVETCARRALEQ